MGLGARGTKILTAFLAVPLTIGYLGRERYGMWMTMSSLLTMLVIVDLGISDGLVNPLAEAVGTAAGHSVARTQQLLAIDGCRVGA